MRPRDRPWNTSATPGSTRRLTEVEVLAAGLTESVLSRVDTGGAIRQPCGSRVLESALMLRLIDRCGCHVEERHALLAYLAKYRTEGTPIDRVLANCAMGMAADTGSLTREVLDRTPTSTRPRRRLLVASLLSLFDGTNQSRPMCDRGEWQDGLHTWAAIEMVAARAIAVSRGIVAGTVTGAHWARLVATQEGAEVWDGNLLAQLLVLHALADEPSYVNVVIAGVTKTLRHQRPDGGFPFVANTDIWCTVTGGLALISGGVATRTRLGTMGDFLADQQRQDCLWSYSELTEQTDLDDSNVCLEFLQLLHPDRYAPIIRRGLEAVSSYQAPDGGFPTYVRGASSESYITAAAVNGLSLAGDRYFDQIRLALDYLTECQLPDGTFESDWSRCRLHCLFRVLLAVSRIPSGARITEVNRMERRAVQAVVDARNDDGGWGQEPGDPSDATSTAYAVLALGGYDQRALVTGAVRFLHGSYQGPKVGVLAPPDMVGPRPFTIDVPILPSIYALLAVGHLRGGRVCCDP